MDIFLWTLQWILAVFFLGVGAMKLLQPYETMAGDVHMAWVEDVGPGVVRLAGTTEVLAAVALTVPGLAGTAQVLIPVAATGLVLQQLLAAAWVHRPRGEIQNLTTNLVIAALALLLAVGRFAEPLV